MLTLMLNNKHQRLLHDHPFSCVYHLHSNTDSKRLISITTCFPTGTYWCAKRLWLSPKPTSFQQFNLESWQLLPFIDRQSAPYPLWMANKMGRGPGMYGFLLGTYQLPLNNRCWIFGILSPTKDICGISTFPKLVFHFQEADMKTSILWHQLTMDFPCEPVWSLLKIECQIMLCYVAGRGAVKRNIKICYYV